MVSTKEAWVERADELLTHGESARYPYEQIQFATSMLTALYGPQSTQVKVFLDGQDGISRTKPGTGSIPNLQSRHALGAIKNAKAELEAGLIVSLRVLVAGEVLAELVRLGKEILEEQTEAAKNVAAVLIAAAFEDLMRRMGEEFASVTGRPKLEDVVNTLKNADVLKGGEVPVALGFLKFRNDSLHAHWENVTRAQVESCIGFIDGTACKALQLTFLNAPSFEQLTATKSGRVILNLPLCWRIAERGAVRHGATR